MRQSNIEIRIEIVKTGVRLWEIEKHLKLPYTTLSRVLRYELDAENREKIMNAIKELSNDHFQD